MKLALSIILFLLLIPLASAGDEANINRAIQAASPGQTVQLASGTYHLTSAIILKSGVSLNGAGADQTVFLCDNPQSNFANENLIEGNGVSNIVLSNFSEDGGWSSNSERHEASNSYRYYEKGVYLSGCHYISIHDIKYKNSMGDFVFCQGGTSNVKVYNTVGIPGHDSFDAWGAGTGLQVFNNYWGTFINSCIKIHDTRGVQIYRNTFYTDTGSGNAGVEVMGGDNSGLNVYRNVFSTLRLHTLYHDDADGGCSGTGNVSNNVFYNSPAYTGIAGMSILSLSNLVTGTLLGYIGTGGYGYDGNGVTDTTGFEGGSDVYPSYVAAEERVFSSIFDILNMVFSETAILGQTSDDIVYSVQQTTHGKIAGGIKIVGFKDEVVIDGETYIPDENAALVKYVAVQDPTFNNFGTAVDSITPTVTVKIENGTANAVLRVVMVWYSVTTNAKTKKTVRTYHTETATFTDSCPAPKILKRPSNLLGSIIEYPDNGMPYSLVNLPSNGLTKVHFDYKGNQTDHYFMIGEQITNQYGIKSTNFTRVNIWKGNIPNFGECLKINGEFDPKLLTVTAYTPYENFEVKEFTYTRMNVPTKFYADWFWPEIGLCVIILFGMRHYYRVVF